jgi:hypothetical protein
LTRITSAQGGRIVFPGLHVRASDAGVVDQDVDAAERFHRGRARLLDLGKVGHVAGDSLRLAAVVELARGLLRERAVAVPDGDRGARIQEPLDNRAADALRAAGYYGAPPGKVDPVGHRGNLAKLPNTCELRILTAALCRD